MEKQNMAEKKYKPVRQMRIKKGDDLKTIYAKVRRSFTAADLQRFTMDEEMVPAEEVIARLKAQAQKSRKRKKG